jgi:hypothetical protein
MKKAPFRGFVLNGFLHYQRYKKAGAGARGMKRVGRGGYDMQPQNQRGNKKY